MIKTAIATTFFPAEEKGVCIRKNQVSVNNTGHNLDTSFFVTLAVIFKWKKTHSGINVNH